MTKDEMVGMVNGADANAAHAQGEANVASMLADGSANRADVFAAADAYWRAYRRTTELVDALNVLQASFPSQLPDSVGEWADSLTQAVSESRDEASRLVGQAIRYANRASGL